MYRHKLIAQTGTTKIMHRLLKPLYVTCLLLLPFSTSAENSTQIPGHSIHHNAIATALLQPEIASSYGIVRSKYRGLLNISVIKSVPGTTGTAVTADVKANWRNLAGKIQSIKLRKVEEGNAIYYIGEFPIVHGEPLRFDLEVKPKGQSQYYKAQLNQEFYID